MRLQEEVQILSKYRTDAEIKQQNVNIEITKIRAAMEQEIMLRLEFESKIN